MRTVTITISDEFFLVPTRSVGMPARTLRVLHVQDKSWTPNSAQTQNP
jgi:hypothetical protein